MIACPPPDKWRDYVREHLGEDEDRLLGEHLEACPACEATLKQLLAPTVAPLAEESTLSDAPPELVERLQRLWEATYAAHDWTDPRRWPKIAGFEILGVLGQGGMGVVFRAWQAGLGREVALKMIAAGERSSAAEVRRLLNDAETAAKLQHPHIVPVYLVDQHNGLPYCVMELIAGGSLAQHMTGIMEEPREAARLVAATARALHYAHQQGVCHRDVKPANILLQPADPPSYRDAKKESVVLRWHSTIPKIADFGLAKRTRDDSGLTLTGAVIGTPGYMAPEQIRSEKPASAGDIYGLGAVLYECVTGQPPFRAATSFDTLLLTLHEEPQRPRALNSRLHRDLETICLKCLEKDPRRRYASAAAVADDLERWLRGHPVQARRVGQLGRIERWCRRNPALAGLSALLALALVGGFLGILHQWRKTEHARQDAVARDEDTRQVLRMLIEFSPTGPLTPKSLRRAIPLESLLSAESCCERILKRTPDDDQTRIILTTVRFYLYSHFSEHGQMAEAGAYCASARDLWEPLVRQHPSNLEYKGWFAKTLELQASATWTLHDPGPAIPLYLQLEALYEELAEEEPANPVWMERVWRCFTGLRNLVGTRAARSTWRRAIEEEVRRRRACNLEGPGNRAARKRFGLLCMFLGDIYLQDQDGRAAIPLWQEAYREHRRLDAERHDNLANQFRLAGCCERLMQERATDPYYLEAVPLLEHVGEQLAKLSEARPEMLWCYAGTLESFDRLASCHVKAGAINRFDEVRARQVGILESLPNDSLANPAHDLSTLNALLQTANGLWEARRSAAGLLLARKVAAVALRYAAAPSRDLQFKFALASHLSHLATVLRHLGAPAEALTSAEQCRRLYDELLVAVPEMNACAQGLSNAWSEIGKARWEIGQHEEALAAIRQSTAVMRHLFEQAPSVQDHRFLLGACLRRQTSFYEKHHDRDSLAATLLEREKLWPDDAKELRQVSDDFLYMAEQIAQAKEKLSAKEEAERQRYVEHGERIRQTAEEALKRTENGRVQSPKTYTR